MVKNGEKWRKVAKIKEKLEKVAKSGKNWKLEKVMMPRLSDYHVTKDTHLNVTSYQQKNTRADEDFR